MVHGPEKPREKPDACAGAEPGECETLRVGICQIALSRPEMVTAQIASGLRQLDDCDIVLLPEYAAHTSAATEALRANGLRGSERERAASLIRASAAADTVISLAEAHDQAILFGCLDAVNGRLVSRAVYHDPRSRVRLVYDKTHVHWTEGFLTPGSALAPLETRLGRIGVLICFDLAFVEAARSLVERGADWLCVLSAVPRGFDWRIVHRRAAGAAVFTQVPVAAACLGSSGLFPMAGHSAIFDHLGGRLAGLGHARSGSCAARLDLGSASAWRRREPVHRHRRPEIYQ